MPINKEIIIFPSLKPNLVVIVFMPSFLSPAVSLISIKFVENNSAIIAPKSIFLGNIDMAPSCEVSINPSKINIAATNAKGNLEIIKNLLSLKGYIE